MCSARIGIIGVYVLGILFSYTRISLAAAPTGVPYSGAIPGGAFSAYFQNITKPCNGSNEMIFAFNSAPGPDYGLRLCREMEFYWKSKDSGNNIFFTGAGNVGIGVENPTSKVDIRGNLGLSGKLVDASNTNFFLQPSLSSTLYKLIIQGEISGPTPVKDEHLATKGYVDAALAAAGGGGLKVYGGDGITVIGNFLDFVPTAPYAYDPYSGQESIRYSDSNGHIKVLWPGQRQTVPNQDIAWPFWRNDPTCTGIASYRSQYQYPSSGGHEEVKRAKDGSYIITSVHNAPTPEWGIWYYWNFGTNTCTAYNGGNTIGIGTRQATQVSLKLCGAADCLIK